MADWTNNDYGREGNPNSKTSYNIKTPLYGGLYNFKKQKNRKVIDLSKTTPRIQVFQGFLNLSSAEEYKIGLYELRTGQIHYLYGFFNIKNGKYYISFDQIQGKIKQQLFYDMYMIPSNEGSKHFDNSYFEFNEFSLLSLYGYRVGKNGLSVTNRHMLLTHIINNKIMTPFEITRHLQGLIALRERRKDRNFDQAIADWQADILFISNYRMNKLTKYAKFEIA